MSESKDEPKKRPAGPFADKFIEFQSALEQYGTASAAFGVAIERKVLDESVREVQHQAKVNVLKLYNDVLSEVQRAEEDEPEGTTFAAVQCIHCHFHELGSKAHLDRDEQWVCDDCWDERMA